MNRVTNAPARKARYKKVLKRTKGYIRSHRKISQAIIYNRHNKKRRWESNRLRKRVQRRFWNKVISIWAQNWGERYSNIIGPLIKKVGDRKEIYKFLTADKENHLGPNLREVLP